MTCSSLGLKIIATAMIVNSCISLTTLARPAGYPIQRELLDRARASLVVITGEDKAGQPVPPGIGFSIGGDLIATDNSVVQLAVRVHVQVPGQKPSTIEAAAHHSYRLATILTVRKTQLPALPLGDSDKVRVNDRVYLVGADALSEGTVSKITSHDDKRYFQISASMMSANRGAPVLNINGEVIGIAAQSPDGKVLGFAIPSSNLTTLVRYRNPNTSLVSAKPGGGTGSRAGVGSGVGPGQSSSGLDPILFPATRPIQLNRVQPHYTEEARRSQTQGTVLVSIFIDTNGDVTQARVLRGLPDGLNEQAIAAALQLKFNPATRNGFAVTSSLAISVEFNLR